MATATAATIASVALAACGDSSEPQLDGAAGRGQQISSRSGCASCHGGANGGASIGPAFAGAWGTVVALDDGTTVTYDADYVRTAIREPDAQVPEGDWRPMPAFDERQLSNDDIDDLIAYIEAIGP